MCPYPDPVIPSVSELCGFGYILCQKPYMTKTPRCRSVTVPLVMLPHLYCLNERRWCDRNISKQRIPPKISLFGYNTPYSGCLFRSQTASKPQRTHFILCKQRHQRQIETDLKLVPRRMYTIYICYIIYFGIQMLL